MANIYYTRGGSFTDGLLARGSSVRNEFEQVESAFDAVVAQLGWRFTNADFPGITEFADNATARASKGIGFDASGNPAIGTFAGLTSAFMATVLDDADAETARQTLAAAGAQAAGLQGAIVEEASGTLYVNPHKGARVSLWNGSTWETKEVAHNTLGTAINTLSGSTTYYAYLYLSSGTLTHELSTTAPTTSGSLVGGLPHKTGSTTHLHVATLQTAAGSPPSTTSYIRNIWDWQRSFDELAETTAPSSSSLRIPISDGTTQSWMTFANFLEHYLDTVLLEVPGNLGTQGAPFEDVDELTIWDDSNNGQRAISIAALRDTIEVGPWSPYAYGVVTYSSGTPSVNYDFNVSSLTDVGVGIVDINFNTSVAVAADNNWVLSGAGVDFESAGAVNDLTLILDQDTGNHDTNTARVYIADGATLADEAFSFVIFNNGKDDIGVV